MEIDFTRPWPRISFMAGLREALGLQQDDLWPANTDLHTEEARAYFLRLVKALRCPSFCLHCTALEPSIVGFPEACIDWVSIE